MVRDAVKKIIGFLKERKKRLKSGNLYNGPGCRFFFFCLFLFLLPLTLLVFFFLVVVVAFLVRSQRRHFEDGDYDDAVDV